jgi:hypothetical protein
MGGWGNDLAFGIHQSLDNITYDVAASIMGGVIFLSLSFESVELGVGNLDSQHIQHGWTRGWKNGWAATAELDPSNSIMRRAH